MNSENEDENSRKHLKQWLTGAGIGLVIAAAYLVAVHAAIIPFHVDVSSGHDKGGEGQLITENTQNHKLTPYQAAVYLKDGCGEVVQTRFGQQLEGCGLGQG